MRRALSTALGLWLGTTLVPAAAAQRLAFEPSAVPDRGRIVTIEVRRSDGRAFCSGEGCRPWVGLAFGKLVRVPTTGSPAGVPTVLRARIGPLSDLWDPPPLPGDDVILVVYQGDRPVSAPIALPVVPADDGVRPAEKRKDKETDR